MSINKKIFKIVVSNEQVEIYILCHDGQWNVDSEFPLRTMMDTINNQISYKAVHISILKRISYLYDIGYTLSHCKFID